MKLLFENWRKYLKEAYGTQTTWDDVHIEDVWNIIGRSCEEGSRECILFKPSVLKSKLKHKPITKTLDPERVKGASLAYPLIVVVNRDTGEYQYIMDGNHRFAQAIQLEKKQLDAEIQVKELYTDEYNQLFGGTE